MIKAVIFDLDGTLVQTETLKAESYAEASEEICPKCASREEVTEEFRKMVGRTREEVAEDIMSRFKLEDAARRHAAEPDAGEPLKAFIDLRMQIYDKILQDPELLRGSRLAHNIDLLREAKRRGLKTGLATTSHRDEACRVLDVLGIEGDFDFIATSEDVSHSKPDPEIYFLVSSKLGVSTRECIAIEDSPTGVKAAAASGAWCIAVTTDFTRGAVHAAGVLDPRWIVDDPSQLLPVFDRMVAERSQEIPAA